MPNRLVPYLLKAKVEEDFTTVTLTVHWIEFLDRYKESKPAPKKRFLGTPTLLALKKLSISPRI